MRGCRTRTPLSDIRAFWWNVRMSLVQHHFLSIHHNFLSVKSLLHSILLQDVAMILHGAEYSVTYSMWALRITSTINVHAVSLCSQGTKTRPKARSSTVWSNLVGCLRSAPNEVLWFGNKIDVPVAARKNSAVKHFKLNACFQTNLATHARSRPGLPCIEASRFPTNLVFLHAGQTTDL